MLGDFLQKTALVEYGDRTYVCRRPTVKTVLLATDLFSPSIVAALGLERKADAPAIDSAAVIAAVAAKFPKRAALVLDSCVEEWRSPPGAVARRASDSPKLCAALAAAVLSIANVDRIIDSLGFDRVTEDGGAAEAVEEGRPLPIEHAIVDRARIFGVSPETVVDWSYEMLLGVRDVQEDAAEDADDRFSPKFLREIKKAANG